MVVIVALSMVAARIVVMPVVHALRFAEDGAGVIQSFTSWNGGVRLRNKE
jgi:hypothetical protein